MQVTLVDSRYHGAPDLDEQRLRRRTLKRVTDLRPAIYVEHQGESVWRLPKNLTGWEYAKRPCE